jgi:hypothetical protein
MSLCEHCSRSLEDCVIAQNRALSDFAVLLVLKENVGYVESIDRVIDQWRHHALPLCSSLAVD